MSVMTLSDASSLANNVICRSITHDPEAYPDPEEFKPERFLKEVDGHQEIDPTVRDPRLCIFGAGRRCAFHDIPFLLLSEHQVHSICAGRYLAENGLWLTIASFLHTFVVEPALDSDGKEIDAPVDIHPGFATLVSVPSVATRKLTQSCSVDT
jgi:hypothetical protein